ncbi:hypothetical protein DCMF_24625 [Candidatus Formimonas warabiya]|uniref:Uncharacterized protein n=2 Tax=Formimonas warabiya TaxID=1761012 RepID=A0A3G1KYI8_FORW1|nr:hypothetical protein DCMF_24625 [Candidatus Formimonas warabiya]
MITPEKLFYQRIVSEWKYNFGAWRTVIDWTVALYILIPFLAFSGYQYLEWWKTTPLWLEPVPFSFFALASLLFAWSGTIRVFLKEADQLFLWNRHKWINTLMGKGIGYSIFLNLVTSVFFFSLLAPFLIGHYRMDIDKLILLGFITFLAKVVLGLSKQLLALIFPGFKQWIILRVLFLFSSLLFVTCIPYLLLNRVLCILCIFILFLVILILIRRRLTIRGSFLPDVERENSERLKYVTFLLKMSGITIKNPKKQKKQPWIFRNSKLIFHQRTAVNGLVEFGIKSMLRNKQRIQLYISFVAICLLAVLGFSTLKWLVWLILAFILTNFVSADWKEAIQSDFMRILPWKKEHLYLATRKFLFLMTLPGLIIISAAMGFQTFSWLGAIAVLPVSVGVAFFMSYIVAFWCQVVSGGRGC